MYDSFDEVERLIREGTCEDLHLEFKSGRPQNFEKFKNDLANDIAAFANSDGGIILIGVAEQKGKAERIDGLDTERIRAEAIEQSIRQKISPPIPRLRINSIANNSASDGLVVLKIEVPQSTESPHHGPDNVYRRRFERTNQPLVHYEIEDLRRRRVSFPPAVVVSIGTRGHALATIDVSNASSLPVTQIEFRFSEGMPWPAAGVPDPLRRGIQHLHPGQSLRFRYAQFHTILADTASQRSALFECQVEYNHPLSGQRAKNAWQLDFEAFRDSMGVNSDEMQWRNDLLKELRSMNSNLADLTRSIKETSQNIVGFDGLDLSLRTFRNLREALNDRPVEPFTQIPDSVAIAKCLGIDYQLADKIEANLKTPGFSRESLSRLLDSSPELVERLFSSFKLSADRSANDD